MDAVKYTFDNRFGEEKRDLHAEEVAALKAEIERTREEAHQQGYAEGEAVGRKAAFDSLEAQLTATLNSLADASRRLQADREMLQQQMEITAAQLAREIGLTVAEHAVSHFPEDDMDLILKQVLESHRTLPGLVVRLASGLTDALQERLEGIRAETGFDGDIQIQGDPAVPVGDIHLQWADGGLNYETKRLAEDVRAAISRFTGDIEQQIEQQATGDAGAQQEGAS